MNKTDMEKYGFTGRFAAEAALYEGLYAGRVFSQYKDFYKVMTENGEAMAEVSGKLRFESSSPSEFPAVGDFVMLDRTDDTGGNAIIHCILARKSVFARKAAGSTNEEQVVASNIDTLFICMSLNNDFSLRRLERYLAIGWDSGAVPVIVLTKADLCEDAGEKLREVEAVAIGVDIIVTSALLEEGLEQVERYMKEGQTVAFIGSSGVGKSTLINCLTDEQRQYTNGLRNDDKGRHTTTRRELIVLASGGMVIDTPGMREIGLESANLAKTFADIDRLAKECRFLDCTHTVEPGCAVQRAVSGGALPAERLASYHKLKKEAKYEGLNSKQIETAKLEEMFAEVGGMKNARRFAKDKNKNR